MEERVGAHLACEAPPQVSERRWLVAREPLYRVFHSQKLAIFLDDERNALPHLAWKASQKRKATHGWMRQSRFSCQDRSTAFHKVLAGLGFRVQGLGISKGACGFGVERIGPTSLCARKNIDGTRVWVHHNFTRRQPLPSLQYL